VEARANEGDSNTDQLIIDSMCSLAQPFCSRCAVRIILKTSSSTVNIVSCEVWARPRGGSSKPRMWGKSWVGGQGEEGGAKDEDLDGSSSRAEHVCGVDAHCFAVRRRAVGCIHMTLPKI
jgi:hypothetical protein